MSHGLPSRSSCICRAVRTVPLPPGGAGVHCEEPVARPQALDGGWAGCSCLIAVGWPTGSRPSCTVPLGSPGHCGEGGIKGQGEKGHGVSLRVAESQLLVVSGRAVQTHSRCRRRPAAFAGELVPCRASEEAVPRAGPSRALLRGALVSASGCPAPSLPGTLRGKQGRRGGESPRCPHRCWEVSASLVMEGTKSPGLRAAHLGRHGVPGPGLR